VHRFHVVTEHRSARGEPPEQPSGHPVGMPGLTPRFLHGISRGRSVPQAEVHADLLETRGGVDQRRARLDCLVTQHERGHA
jgi:hypothetical protein